METKPVSIDSVIQAGELVRFVSYTDPISMTGYELVEQVTTDANGRATLTATPPANKTLCAICHIVSGGSAYSRFRILSNDFSTGDSLLVSEFTSNDVVIDTGFESTTIDAIRTEIETSTFVWNSQLNTEGAAVEELVPDPTNAGNQVWKNSLTATTTDGVARVQFGNDIDSRSIREGLSKVRMYISSDIELFLGASGYYFVNLHELWIDQPGTDDSFRISLYIGEVGTQTLTTLDDFMYWNLVGEMRLPNNIVWQETNTVIAVPLDQWFEMEFYYKSGDANNGQIIVTIKPDGGTRETIFDVSNTTNNPIKGTESLLKWQNLKWYTANGALKYLTDQGGSLDIYYDDWKWWSKGF